MNHCRSFLYAPATHERRMRKALSSDADAVIFDLEDAVPIDEKAKSRATAAGLLRELESGEPSSRPFVFVRIDPLGDWRADLRAVVGPALAGVRLPKVDDPSFPRAVASTLDELEPTLDVPRGQTTITCSIESAAGVLAAPLIAQGQRVELLSFGALDYLRDIDGEGDGEGENTVVPLSLLVLASRAGGLPGPCGPVHATLEDEDGLRSSSQRLRSLGFSGRSCIHPSQVSVVNEFFTPSAEDLSEAKEIVALAAAAEADGVGVLSTSRGRFVDRPQIERARRVLAKERST